MSDAVKKIDIRVPTPFLEQVDELIAQLGVTRNAFFMMAAADLGVRVIQLGHLKKSEMKLKKLERGFQTALAITAK